jgi:hypothetical protein
LLDRVLREIFAGVLLVDRLVRFAQFLQAFGRDVGVFGDLVLLLDLVERVFERVVIHAHHDVAEHVDQAAIGVVSETLVLGRLGQPFGGGVVQTQVQNRVHHARHADRGTRADRDQQRVFVVAELLAEFLFERFDAC